MRSTASCTAISSSEPPIGGPGDPYAAVTSRAPPAPAFAMGAAAP